MPAHIGFMEKLKLPRKFLGLALSQTPQARRLRSTGLLSMAALEADLERKRREREKYEVTSYGSFRSYLDDYSPVDRDGIRGTQIADPREWELFLKPGTVFDRQMQIVFEEFKQRGVDFRVIFIQRKSDTDKLKRLEGVAFGEVTVLWSSASGSTIHRLR